jgi:hypothetical protein
MPEGPFSGVPFLGSLFWGPFLGSLFWGPFSGGFFWGVFLGVFSSVVDGHFFAAQKSQAHNVPQFRLELHCRFSKDSNWSGRPPSELFSFAAPGC